MNNFALYIDFKLNGFGEIFYFRCFENLDSETLHKAQYYCQSIIRSMDKTYYYDFLLFTVRKYFFNMHIGDKVIKQVETMHDINYGDYEVRLYVDSAYFDPKRRCSKTCTSL